MLSWHKTAASRRSIGSEKEQTPPVVSKYKTCKEWKTKIGIDGLSGKFSNWLSPLCIVLLPHICQIFFSPLFFFQVILYTAAAAASWVKLKGDSLSKENDRVIILHPDPSEQERTRKNRKYTKDGPFSIKLCKTHGNLWVDNIEPFPDFKTEGATSHFLFFLFLKEKKNSTPTSTKRRA